MRHMLKLALLREGVAQYRVAASCGISETRLSRLVQGRARPSSDERAKLASELGIPETDLFGEDLRGDR